MRDLGLVAQVRSPHQEAPTIYLYEAVPGGVGLMTVAVMTRATLGHTGQELHAGLGTVAIYLALVTAVLARVVAGVWTDEAMAMHSLAGVAWIGAFGGYAVLYGRFLLRLPPAKRI